MYLQNVESFWDMQWAPGVRTPSSRRGEWEWSAYNFEQADTPAHFAAFDQAKGSANAC